MNHAIYFLMPINVLLCMIDNYGYKRPMCVFYGWMVLILNKVCVSCIFSIFL